MAEIAPDTLIDGRYRILTRIGTGGMADVYCAEDQQLGRKVALKLLHRRFAEDAEFVERFRREASAAAGLQHPNVVGVYDRGEWDGTYYIAMEYLPGRSLKDVIRQEAPLDPVRSIDLTVQILKAARFAHRRGIVHRDLKPHNVLVDDEDRAKVTDFGIARAGASDMTETGSIMGTAQYISPEQAQGHVVGDASDLYAIGVILFELLTGHVPFDADSAVSIALKHVSEAPPAPTMFDPSVPPALESIVLWALEKDPAQRPADADAFINALEEARDAVVSGEAPGQRTAMFAPAAIPVPVDPAYAYGDETAVTEPEPAAAPPPPYYATGEHAAAGDEHDERRRPPWWAWLLAALALAAIVLGAVLLTQPDEVTVPGVVGADVQEASADLRAVGLRGEIVRVTSGRPVGEVLSQDPVAGARADEGSTVTLEVSRGPGEVQVPSVDGLGERRATAQLTNAGLVVGRVVRQEDESVREGRVIRSSPAAGTTVDRGSEVTLVVSSGPQQATVPDVGGLSRGAAEQAIRDADLDASVVEEATGDAEPGTVLRQDPAAGVTVEPGSTVTIVVARAVPAVEVPDVLGLSRDEAVGELDGAGLESRESTRTVSDEAEDGIVLDQRPSPGEQVRAGAPVRIYVGRFVEPAPPEPTPPGDGGDGG